MEKNISRQRKIELNEKMYKWLAEHEPEFKELMSYYRCAMMEVSTKFNVLQEELSLKFDRNPIESIKTRLKTTESIIEKLMRKNMEISVENMEREINDIAGIRIITSFPSDVYNLSEALLTQDDVILIEKKDYIKNPKNSGYRSLHLIIAIPIFLHDHKKVMTVEVQFRTIAMDWWASLEHKIMYKRDLPAMPQAKDALLRCSLRGYYLDMEMERIYKESVEEIDSTKPIFSDRLNLERTKNE